MQEPVVIGQDEQSELHVQSMIQSGRRQLDIRMWRRGPTGFAPSRSALTLSAADVDALREGIAELLEASNGGRQVARVVWDKDEGRRLRAETEPFGTRFTARLGFWQRVRDSWKPAGDGLQLDAEQLEPLQKVLTALRPRLHEPQPDTDSAGTVTLQPTALQRWPTPGADWLTVDPDRLAFHPRGIRITATVTEDGEEHRLELRQWRRQESLWLPEEVALRLSVPDLDALLSYLRQLADSMPDSPGAGSELPCESGAVLRVLVHHGESPPLLRIEERPCAEEESDFAPRLVLPVAYLPRFGRMLAQSGMVLITHLSAGERAELQNRKGPEIAPTIVDDALVPVVPEPVPPPPTNPEEIAMEQGEADPPETETIVAAPAEPEPVPRFTPLGEVQLGHQHIAIALHEERGRHLALQWSGRCLYIPLDHVEAMLADLRTLYYDALRGRRGYVSTVGGTPTVHMSVHNRGHAIAVELEHDIGGTVTRLAFPVAEVPAFLNAAGSAIGKVWSRTAER